MKNRIEWIDILKGIGIFYVTLGHLNPAMPIEKHIYSFHMFLFFFLSGYLFHPVESIPSAIKKNAVKYMIPYLFYGIASVVYSMLIGRSPDLKLLLFWKGEAPFNAVIWFLWILFLVSSIHLIADKVWFHQDWKKELVLMAVLLPIIWKTNGINLTLKITIVPAAYFFYLCGTVYRKIKTIPFPWLIFFTALSLNIVCGVILNERVSVIRCIYGNTICCLTAGVAGITAYVLLCRKMYMQKLLSPFRYLGQRSMFIMCTQYFVFDVVAKLAWKFFKINDAWHDRGTGKAFLVCFISMTIILTVEYIIRKIDYKPLRKLMGI